MTRWISATVNEEYSDDELEGIEDLAEGHTVILYDNGTWYET